MNFKKIISYSDKLGVISELQKGKVIVILTDTIYGLSCLASNKESIKKIYQIKNREKNKPFLVLIGDMKILEEYFFVDNWQKNILNKIWFNKKERSTTFILKPKIKLINFLGNNYKDGVAVRLPKNNFLIKILKSLKEPLISTSCNISGEKNLNNISDIKYFFKDKKYKPDSIIFYSGLRPKRKSSQIIDIRNRNDIKKIRD